MKQVFVKKAFNSQPARHQEDTNHILDLVKKKNLKTPFFVNNEFALHFFF